MKKEYMYLYWHTPSNFRTVLLLPIELRSSFKHELGRLEGLLITKKAISSAEDYEFPITQKEEIAEKYDGRYLIFDKYA